MFGLQASEVRADPQSGIAAVWVAVPPAKREAQQVRRLRNPDGCCRRARTTGHRRRRNSQWRWHRAPGPERLVLDLTRLQVDDREKAGELVPAQCRQVGAIGADRARHQARVVVQDAATEAARSTDWSEAGSRPHCSCRPTLACAERVVAADGSRGNAHNGHARHHRCDDQASVRDGGLLHACPLTCAPGTSPRDRGFALAGYALAGSVVVAQAVLSTNVCRRS